MTERRRHKHLKPEPQPLYATLDAPQQCGSVSPSGETCICARGHSRTYDDFHEGRSSKWPP
jgi:hypothetical protein